MIEKVLKSLSKLELFKIIRDLESELQRVTKERDDIANRLKEVRQNVYSVTRQSARDISPGYPNMSAGIQNGFQAPYLVSEASANARAIISEAEQKRAQIEMEQRKNVEKMRGALDFYVNQLNEVYLSISAFIDEMKTGPVSQDREDDFTNAAANGAK